MNRITTLAGSMLIAMSLAACSPGINGTGHRITFDSNGMVIHATGHPDAHVSQDGDLRIGGESIAVTPAQRQLLQHYYRQAGEVMQDGRTMGKHGVSMAERGIGDAIASIFHGDSATAEKRMDAESQKMESDADALCANVKALGATQKTIAAEIPAFAPYASGDQMHCVVTHTVTIRSNGSKSTSFKYSLHEGNGTNTATIRSSSQATQPANAPSAHQP